MRFWFCWDHTGPWRYFYCQKSHCYGPLRTVECCLWSSAEDVRSGFQHVALRKKLPLWSLPPAIAQLSSRLLLVWRILRSRRRRWYVAPKCQAFHERLRLETNQPCPSASHLWQSQSPSPLSKQFRWRHYKLICDQEFWHFRISIEMSVSSKAIRHKPLCISWFSGCTLRRMAVVSSDIPETTLPLPRTLKAKHFAWWLPRKCSVLTRPTKAISTLLQQHIRHVLPLLAVPQETG
jgi:hypothetical protein